MTLLRHVPTSMQPSVSNAHCTSLFTRDMRHFLEGFHVRCSRPLRFLKLKLVHFYSSPVERSRQFFYAVSISNYEPTLDRWMRHRNGRARPVIRPIGRAASYSLTNQMVTDSDSLLKETVMQQDNAVAHELKHIGP